MTNLPDVSDLLRVWECGDPATTPERALLALGPAHPDAPFGELRELSVGARTERLIHLRRALSGPLMNCLAECGTCRQSLEFVTTVDELLDGVGERSGAFTVESEGFVIRCRALDSRDLTAVAHSADVAEARNGLIARCIVSVADPDGSRPESLPGAVVAAIAEALSENDPLCGIRIPIRCDYCGEVSAPCLDVMTFLWAEIERRARSALQDVRELARVYGWSETEILRMGEARRAFYLEGIE